MVSVDESIISRNTARSYSWSKKGQEAEMKLTWFCESISMVAAVFSTGEYFIHLYSNSINSETFIEFLIDLKKYIKNNQIFKKRRISILLDNTPTHRAKTSINILKKKFDRLIFIPPYTLQDAPIEHFFGFLKSSIKAYHTSKVVNLRSREGEQIIKTWVLGVRPASIVGSFAHWFGVMREDIRAYINSSTK